MGCPYSKIEFAFNGVDIHTVMGLFQVLSLWWTKILLVDSIGGKSNHVILMSDLQQNWKCLLQHNELLKHHVRRSVLLQGCCNMQSIKKKCAEWRTMEGERVQLGIWSPYSYLSSLSLRPHSHAIPTMLYGEQNHEIKLIKYWDSLLCINK